MKIKELRELNVEELGTRRGEIRKEMLHSRVQQAAGQLENSARLNLMRKEVARIETLITERRLNLSRNAGKVGAKGKAAPAEPAKKPAKKSTRKAKTAE